MKNIKSHLKFQKIKKINFAFTRSRNEWEPASSYPYDSLDEHEPPKQEDIIREVFDREYYKFGFKAASDDHHDVDMFNQYRQWQHLYTHPKDPILGWRFGSPTLKYLWVCFPLIIFTFYFVLLTVMI